MLHGSPSPLPSTVLLPELLALARPGDLLGAWIRGSGRLLRLRLERRFLLAGSDLGALLRRCSRIAVRHRDQTVVVDAERLIAWRTLRIVTGAADLPGMEQLRVLIPDLQVHGSRIEAPIGVTTSEEVLAACVAARVPVVASWVAYRD